MSLDIPSFQRVGTNYAPTDSEKTDIRAIVRARQAIVDGIDKEIREVEQALTALKEQHASHTEYIDGHLSLLSPIRDLPVDILSSIFLACLAHRRTHSNWQWRMLSCKHPSVVLSHVCRGWREMALSMPRLWDEIYLELPRYEDVIFSDRDNEHQTYERFWLDLNEQERQIQREHVTLWEEKAQKHRELIETWILRSGECPLTVIFEWDQRYPASTPAEVTNRLRELLGLAWSVSHRWKKGLFETIFVNHTAPVLEPFFHLGPEQYPLLTDLRLCLDFTSTVVNYDLARRVGILKAGSLDSLSLAISGRTGVSDLGVQYASLSELNLWYGRPSFTRIKMDVDQVLDLLQACPRLIQVVFGTTSRGVRDDDDEQPLPSNREGRPRSITLAHLRTMEIFGSELPPEFPYYFVLPSLRSLSVFTLHNTRNEDNSALVNWIRSYGQQLTDATFFHPTLTPTALIHVLERLPNVSRLQMSSRKPGRFGEVASARLVNSLMERFVPKPSDTGSILGAECLCPKLEVLNCKLGEPEFTEAALVKLIEARRNVKKWGGMVRRIEAVSVTFNTEKKLGVIQALLDRQVDMEDFKLSVSYVHMREGVYYGDGF